MAAWAWPAAAADCDGSPLRLRAESLQAAHAQATDPAAKARAAAALGSAYLQLARWADAEPLLDQAAAVLPDPRERAAALVDLGQVQLARRRAAAADASWSRAAAMLPADAELALVTELNRLGLLPEDARVPRLRAAHQRLSELSPAVRLRPALHLAALARALGGAGRELAASAYEQGRSLALAAGQARLAAEAYDGLAALAEDDSRWADALALVEHGIAQAQRVDARERLLALEARAARLLQRLGDGVRALAAWQRAVEHVEAVRADIPVQYVDGRSSFRDTLEPVYLGLTDALLRRADAAAPTERDALLRRSRDTVELIKQTELEDWLRDRCSVGSARNDRRGAPAAGTAVWYPIILPDRLELLLETAAGIERRSVAIEGERLRHEVLDLVAALRAGTPMRARSQALYRVLIEPFGARLEAERIHTLLAVPDGVLRLLPLASLHDGQRWLIERLAIATSPALSLQAAAAPSTRAPRMLLAGLAEPGPVVDKLSTEVVASVLDPSPEPGPARGRSDTLPAPGDPSRTTRLRDALALPGVKDEVERLRPLMPGTVLVDRAFTLTALREQMGSHRHSVVHIASHGVFGDSAESTFIMTWDELLTLDALQALLRDGRGRGRSIELLTLSACQTAEGDDRAPLGMSGSALKANARSALGTLWPVSDEAATRVMAGFYQRWTQGGQTRAQALRAAQLELLAERSRSHPFHWAPFVLIGDWQ